MHPLTFNHLFFICKPKPGSRLSDELCRLCFQPVKTNICASRPLFATERLVVENPSLTDVRVSVCVIIRDLEKEGRADEEQRRSLKVLLTFMDASLTSSGF